MNFLDSVNRILRAEGIVSGDDDDATSFSDTAHSNMINLAKIAIQDELSDYVSGTKNPYEEADGYITFVASQQIYSLETNFIRMLDDHPFMEKVDAATSTGVAQSDQLQLYRGGEAQLRRDVFDYRTQTGDPIYFYFTGGTTSKIGVYPIPESAGDIYRYDYQKDVSVTAQGDILPFIQEITAQAFSQAAAIRFRALRLEPTLRKQLYPEGVAKDPEHQAARARIAELVKRTPPVRSYGRRYT